MEPIKISHKKLYPMTSHIADVAGIYAWYYDYTNLIDILNGHGSKDLIISSFLQELENISRKLKLPNISGTLKGKLNTEYSCLIENIDYIKVKSYDTKMASVNLDMLKQVIYVLQNYSAPLYIGKAVKQSIRERYKQHIKDYDDAEAGNDFKNKFGYRLHKIGLSPSQLIFKYHKLPNREIEIDIIEHIINRINKPTLGER